MIESVVGLFDKLVDQFTWRRLVFTICGFVMLVAFLFAYESFTGNFRLARIEKETELLDKLIVQGENVSTNSDPEIMNAHKALIKELDVLTNPQNENYTSWYLKMFCAALPWMLTAFFVRLTTGKLERSTTGGIIAFAIPFCMVGAWLPTFNHPWINYLGYPWISFSIVCFFLIRFGKQINPAPVTPPQKPPD